MYNLLLGEESDVASEDELAERDGDSETEQEGETDDQDNNADTSFILGKDKHTKWNKNPPRANVRRGTHNIITHLPGVKGNARPFKTAVDCLHNLFADEMLELIVKCTQPLHRHH
ncbi:hypothetical protein WA026_019520 [Henosepilachna vigintioctopunctata]|uniref:Uncharacterized protein n=1 Tax=Henosepilachna vigintioctopunctata TaxID=420089 RepID=A0AAW1TWH8_9CUCU